MKKIISVIVIAIILIAIGVYFLRSNNKKQMITKEVKMIISSPAFVNNAAIPSQYTCDGNNVNPPLTIAEMPVAAQSLVLIMDDPDAPAGTWVHWTIWNIDPKITEIAENSAPLGAVEGTTSFGQIGYGGPCPHSGRHRYFFKLYALDTKLDLSPETDKSQLEKAMSGHILAQSELVGLYQRQ